MPSLQLSNAGRFAGKFSVKTSNNGSISITSTLRGHLPQSTVQLMNRNGAGYTLTDCRTGQLTSGGHPTLRSIIDYLQAKAISEIVEVIKNNPGKRFLIRDLGAKYQAMSGLLLNAFPRAGNPVLNFVYQP